MNYRERLYKSYITSHFGHVFKLNLEEYRFFMRKYQKQIRSLLPKEKKAQICDLACGSGHFLYFLQQIGYDNSCGVDISPEQIKQAQNMGIKNVVCDNIFNYLNDKNGIFDFISAHAIIAHLSKDEILQLFDLVYTALKPGGKFLITTVNAGSLFGARKIYIDFTHETSFTETSLAQVYRVCGFKNIQIVGEKIFAHNFRSTIRKFLWEIVSFIIKGYIVIEAGFLQYRTILESRIIGIGEK